MRRALLCAAVASAGLAQGAAAGWLAGAQPDAWLGFAVAGVGDVDGNGTPDTIAAALLHDAAHDEGGLAFLLRGAEGGAIAPEPLAIVADQGGAALGHFVSAAGDVNGDGFDDIVVGSPHFGVGGALFVLRGSANGVGFRTAAASDARIVAEVADSAFGAAFAPAGDVDGDGFDDIVVGAPEEGIGGAVHLFHGGPQGIVATEPAQAATRLAGPTPGARFGYAVAGAGDWNGDGFDDIAVGAPLGGEAGGGAVHLYFGSAQGIADGAVPITIEGEAFGDRLGSAVALRRDRGGDGLDALFAGAPGRSAVLPSAGAVLAVPGSRHGGVARAWTHGDRAFAQLGFSVADAGERRWIAGAPFRSDDDRAHGGALVAAPEPSAWLAALTALSALSAGRGTSRACAAASDGGCRAAAPLRRRFRRRP